MDANEYIRSTLSRLAALRFIINRGRQLGNTTMLAGAVTDFVHFLKEQAAGGKPVPVGAPVLLVANQREEVRLKSEHGPLFPAYSFERGPQTLMGVRPGPVVVDNFTIESVLERAMHALQLALHADWVAFGVRAPRQDALVWVGRVGGDPPALCAYGGRNEPFDADRPGWRIIRLTTVADGPPPPAVIPPGDLDWLWTPFVTPRLPDKPAARPVPVQDNGPAVEPPAKE